MQDRGGGENREPKSDRSIGPLARASSPNDDDDEVQQVPAVPDVGAGVHHQTVGQDLQEGLHREDDEEDVLHLFLQQTKKSLTVSLSVFVPALQKSNTLDDITSSGQTL